MTSTSDLTAWRDKYIAMRDRGGITDTETSSAFIDLLTLAPDDESALSLCAGLPGWFRKVLCEQLNELSATRFYRCLLGIGDSRTPEELHLDALRQQAKLQRLAPRIRRILQLASE